MIAAMVMVSAAMLPAGVLLAVVMVVMTAPDVWVEFQAAGGQGLCSLVSLPGYAAVQLDSGCCQGRLGSASDAAADQGIHLQGTENTANAPWPLPLVSTTSEEVITPSVIS